MKNYMGSTLYIDDVCVGLSSACNWTCPYCISYSDQSVNEELLLKEVRKIKHLFQTHVVSGGEPGILSDNFWSRFFKTVQVPVEICTNGTFILKGFHEKYKSHIKSIDIHAVENVYKNAVIADEVLDAYKANPHWQMNIVIDNWSAHHFGTFLDKYPDITFVLNFADGHPKLYKPDYDRSIGKTDAKAIIRELTGRKEYKEYSSRIMRAIIKNNFANLNNWTPKNRAFVSDRAA